ncbi:MAG: hypothetical protein CBARDMAM_4116 [uncultured Caballeronia sp.]|nr:MAG: hypothetical protein CBARDMAM_4116 [uncultured Caballeronia sp.]
MFVDRIAGLTPGSPAYATRHKRDKVTAATQRSYEALFDPALPDLSLSDRLLVALYACTLSTAPALATHYAERLASINADRAVIDQIAQGLIDAQEPRLRAMLAFTRTLIESPIDGDKTALERLPVAGIPTLARGRHRAVDRLSFLSDSPDGRFARAAGLECNGGSMSRELKRMASRIACWDGTRGWTW